MQRKDSRKSFKDKAGWYALTRFGQKHVNEEIKIVSPGEVKGHKFCIDYSKAGFSCARVFAITINDSDVNLKYILALLNSNLVKFFGFTGIRVGRRLTLLRRIVKNFCTLQRS